MHIHNLSQPQQSASASDVENTPNNIKIDGEKSVIRIAIFDDHPIMREGLLHSFERESEFEVVGQGGSAEDAISITEMMLPDLILLDINMPGDGLEAAKVISRSCPAVRIIMLTAHDSEQHVIAALRSGASGYVLKGVSSQELLRMVRSVHEGEGYVSPGLAARLIGKTGRLAHRPSYLHDELVDLSEREEEILRYVSDGQSNREIGQHLGLTEKTIKHYITNILQKLHVRNRVEAALVARERFKSSS